MRRTGVLEVNRRRATLIAEAADGLANYLCEGGLTDWTVTRLTVGAALTGPAECAEDVASVIADQESIDALICILPCIPKDLVEDPSDRQEWMAATQRELSVLAGSCAAGIPLLRAGSRVIAVCDEAGITGAASASSRAAAAGAAIGFMKCLSLELAKEGILVNTIVRRGSLTHESSAACVEFLANEGDYFSGQILYSFPWFASSEGTVSR
jgi:NAD(P)-dependent dehydrogenase (short-subunit alcohol dehydrogenase family)